MTLIRACLICLRYTGSFLSAAGEFLRHDQIQRQDDTTYISRTDDEKKKQHLTEAKWQENAP